MSMDLFSIFDPNCFLFFDFNWMSMLIVFIIYPYMYWFIPSRSNFLLILIYSFMSSELICLINNKYKLNLIYYINIFLFVLVNNIFSIFPYVFCSTSHLILGLSFAMPMWFTMNLYMFINYLDYSLAHYVPTSTPNFLISFMVFIETISNVIRPLTLSVRLSANLTAGHLILSLIGLSFFISKYFIIIIIMVQTCLFILEMSVSFIQSYVFSVLLTLYLSEVKNE
uniref:ATP synthase subunit a n=1 Tax=Dielis plumipes fossulana TaxID=2977626 RepID=A0A1W5LKP9_9HYME